MLLDLLGESYSLCSVVAIYLVRRKLFALLRRWHLPSWEDARSSASLGRGLVPVGNILAFPAEALYIYSDDGCAVEGLLYIDLPLLHIIGAELLQQQVERMSSLLFREVNVSTTSKDHALVLSGELAWKQVHPSYDTEGDLTILGKGSELLAFGCTMDIDAACSVPDVIDGDAIGCSFLVDHGEDSVLFLLEELEGSCFVEETITSSDIVIAVVHDFRYL